MKARRMKGEKYNRQRQTDRKLEVWKKQANRRNWNGKRGETSRKPTFYTSCCTRSAPLSKGYWRNTTCHCSPASSLTASSLWRSCYETPQAECLSTRKNDHKTPYLRFAVTTPTPPIHNALWLMSTPLNRMAGVKASALQSGSTVPVSKKNKPQVAPVCYPQLHTIKRMNYKKKGKPH